MKYGILRISAVGSTFMYTHGLLLALPTLLFLRFIHDFPDPPQERARKTYILLIYYIFVSAGAEQNRKTDLER